jgi:hypothetical protein
VGARGDDAATFCATLRSALRFIAVLGFVVSACAVGTLDDGSVPDPPPGDGADAAPEVGSPVDAAPADDSSSADVSQPPVDTGAPRDTGPKDTGPLPDTGPPDTGSTCAAAGFSGALLKFDLSSQPGTEATAAPTTTATGVTGGALTRGGALTPTAGSGSMNSSNWPVLIDPTKFYTFTITPAAGCTVALTTLALDLSASGSGPLTADVATSPDNFGSPSTPVSTSGTASVSLAGVSGTGAIEIRVYGNGASSAAGTFRIQNTLTLSGTLN